MQEQLNYLVLLQQMDNAIRRLQMSLDGLPEKLQAVDLEIHKVEESFQRFTVEWEELKKKRKGLEREIEDLDQKIKKSQIKLMEVKTNKEYRAMLTETEELKKAKIDKEDLLLDLMEKTETGLKQERIWKKELEHSRAEGKRKKERLEEEGEEERNKLTALKVKREELASRVNGDLLKQYEFLKNRLGGLAVAEVKNGICLGCHMQITPQLYNVLQRQDQILTCPSCLRIIHFVKTADKEEE